MSLSGIVRASGRRVKSNVDKLRERLQDHVEDEFLQIALEINSNNVQAALEFIAAQRRGAQPAARAARSRSSTAGGDAEAKGHKRGRLDDDGGDDGDDREEEEEEEEEEDASVEEDGDEVVPNGDDDDEYNSKDDDNNKKNKKNKKKKEKDEDEDKTRNDDDDDDNTERLQPSASAALTDELVDPSAPSQPPEPQPLPAKRSRQPRRRALGDENRNGNAKPPTRRRDVPELVTPAAAVAASDDNDGDDDDDGGAVLVAKKKRRREPLVPDTHVVASPPVTDSPAPSLPVLPLVSPPDELEPVAPIATAPVAVAVAAEPVVVAVAPTTPRAVELSSVDVTLTPLSDSRVKPAEPCNIACLPEVLLSRLLTMFFESGVPLATLSLVCRAFRRNLRPWPRFVRISLARLTSADAAGVRAYAELVARNAAADAVPRAPPPHPLATLLRDVRMVEFRDGADSGALGELLVALAQLKGASLGHRFDASDAQGEDGLRRRLLVRRDEACRGRDVAPLCGLALQQCVVDDDALVELAQRAGRWLRSLECVYCAGVQGAAVRALAALQPPAPLYTLQLDHCPALAPRFFANLGRLQSLRHVAFRSCALMGAPELMHEIAKLPHLKTLGLSDALQTDDRSLQVLYEARLTSLRAVDLVGARKVTIDGLWDLLRIDGLARVNAMWVAPLAADEVHDLRALAERNRVELKCTAEPCNNNDEPPPPEPAEQSGDDDNDEI